VLQFGKYKESTESGLRWRLPYPIQSHELVNISGVRTSKSAIAAARRTRCSKKR
jgi:membrane protease subunit HflK